MAALNQIHHPAVAKKVVNNLLTTKKAGPVAAVKGAAAVVKKAAPAVAKKVATVGNVAKKAVATVKKVVSQKPTKKPGVGGPTAPKTGTKVELPNGVYAVKDGVAKKLVTK